MTDPTPQQIREAADTLTALQCEGNVMTYPSWLPDDLRRIAELAELAEAAKATARDALIDALAEDMLGPDWQVSAGGWWSHFDGYIDHANTIRDWMAKVIDLGWTKGETK